MKIALSINSILAKFFRIKIVRCRDMRPSVECAKKQFGNKEIVAVEVGVFDGENALSILKNLNVRTMYLVDPYEQYDDYKNTYDMKSIKRKAEQKLKKYKTKVVWIEKKSSAAFADIPENVDFIYLDGSHLYKYVKEDMDLYYPKVKVGGVFAGHDISNLRVTGVAKAFCEFVSERKLTPNIFGCDWWVVK